MDELKQEDWEAQTTFNEIDIDPIIEGGDNDEATDENTTEEQ